MVVKEQIGRVDYGVKHVFLYESRIKKSRTHAAMEAYCQIVHKESRWFSGRNRHYVL